MLIGEGMCRWLVQNEVNGRGDVWARKFKVGAGRWVKGSLCMLGKGLKKE